MTLRSVFLFIHVMSAMAVCGALAIEGALLLRLRRAAGMSALREALDGFRLLRILVPLSLAPTVMSGMFLVQTVWGWRAAWINVALASLVLAAVAGVATTALRIAHLRKAGRRAESADYDDARDPILSASFVMRAAIFTGIVFLMTAKAGLSASLAAMGTAAAVGSLASLAAVINAMRSQGLLKRVSTYGLAVLVLTTVHHVYGAYVYNTPWRLDAAWVSGVAAAVMAASLLVLRRDTDDAGNRIAFWTFVAVVIVFPIVAIGVFEGAYNHAMKDALYFAGASPSTMARMFPPPTYELPNDAFFEITGVLQVVPAAMTGWLLYALVRRTRRPHRRFIDAADGSAVPSSTL